MQVVNTQNSHTISSLPTMYSDTITNKPPKRFSLSPQSAYSDSTTLNKSNPVYYDSNSNIQITSSHPMSNHTSPYLHPNTSDTVKKISLPPSNSAQNVSSLLSNSISIKKSDSAKLSSPPKYLNDGNPTYLFNNSLTITKSASLQVVSNASGQNPMIATSTFNTTPSKLSISQKNGNESINTTPQSNETSIITDEK